MADTSPPNPAPDPTAAISSSPPPAGRSSRPTLVVVLAAVIALVLAAGGGFLLANRDDDKSADDKSADDHGGEIFLEASDDEGDNPFMASVASGRSQIPSTTTAPDGNSNDSDKALVSGVKGSQPALYGGTQDKGSCDPEKLIDFLRDNDDKAAAWASVFGIQTSDIADYVHGLTPVVLTRDTRVTNHGYANGRATTLQSVLEAGTAVLVDRFGVPRVKCNCGNPLAPPEPTPVTPTYVGTQWPNFSSTTIVVVNQNIRVRTFVLVDPDGNLFTRPAGTDGGDDADLPIEEGCRLFPDDPNACPDGDAGPGEPDLGTGDVQVTLRWDSGADLDLAVADPAGATLSYGSSTSPSGGVLDVDAYAGCAASAAAVENVFWPTAAAPAGSYSVTVTYFAECPNGSGPQAYTLEIRVGGRLLNPDDNSATAINSTLTVGQAATYTFSFEGGLD